MSSLSVSAFIYLINLSINLYLSNWADLPWN